MTGLLSFLALPWKAGILVSLSSSFGLFLAVLLGMAYSLCWLLLLPKDLGSALPYGPVCRLVGLLLLQSLVPLFPGLWLLAFRE